MNDNTRYKNNDEGDGEDPNTAEYTFLTYQCKIDRSGSRPLLHVNVAGKVTQKKFQDVASRIVQYLKSEGFVEKGAVAVKAYNYKSDKQQASEDSGTYDDGYPENGENGEDGLCGSGGSGGGCGF